LEALVQNWEKKISSGDCTTKTARGVIFREARHLLSLHFQVFSISNISRSCNTCAHELARLSVDRDPDHPSIWHDPLPEFVTRIVGRDISTQLGE